MFILLTVQSLHYYSTKTCTYISCECAIWKIRWPCWNAHWAKESRTRRSKSNNKKKFQLDETVPKRGLLLSMFQNQNIVISGFEMNFKIDSEWLVQGLLWQTKVLVRRCQATTGLVYSAHSLLILGDRNCDLRS